MNMFSKPASVRHYLSFGNGRCRRMALSASLHCLTLSSTDALSRWGRTCRSALYSLRMISIDSFLLHCTGLLECQLFVILIHANNLFTHMQSSAFQLHTRQLVAIQASSLHPAAFIWQLWQQAIYSSPVQRVYNNRLLYYSFVDS